MAGVIPTKIENGATVPFDPNDDVPPAMLDLPHQVIAGANVRISVNRDGSINVENTCCTVPGRNVMGKSKTENTDVQP